MTELKQASSVKVLTAEGAACTTTVFAAEATAPAPAEPAAPAKAAGPWTQTKDRDNAKMYKETTRVIWDEDLPSGTKKIPRKIK